MRTRSRATKSAVKDAVVKEDDNVPVPAVAAAPAKRSSSQRKNTGPKDYEEITTAKSTTTAAKATTTKIASELSTPPGVTRRRPKAAARGLTGKKLLSIMKSPQFPGTSRKKPIKNKRSVKFADDSSKANTPIHSPLKENTTTDSSAPKENVNSATPEPTETTDRNLSGEFEQHKTAASTAEDLEVDTLEEAKEEIQDDSGVEVTFNGTTDVENYEETLPPSSPAATNLNVTANILDIAQRGASMEHVASPDDQGLSPLPLPTTAESPGSPQGHKALFGDATLPNLYGEEANEEVRQDIIGRIQKTFLKSHKRPIKFGQVKGSHTRKKATSVFKKFFELAGMSSPEDFDQEGKSTANWPKFQHATVTIDEVIDAPNNGVWPKPGDAKGRKRLIFGLFDEAQKDLLSNTLTMAQEQNFESSDDLEIVFLYNHVDLTRNVFSRKGNTRNRPTASKTVKAATKTLEKTPSRNTTIDLSMM